MALNLGSLGSLLKRSFRLLGGTPPSDRSPQRPPGTRASVSTAASRSPGDFTYPGDFTGRAAVSYSPNPNGRADPGEIVWSWVPFEEDHGRGKDRPVLLIGHDREWLLGLMLTSKDHDGHRHEQDYVDIGSGPWDPFRRPSEVRVDRIIRLDPQAIRREGAVLDQRAFRLVGDVLRGRYGWT